MPYNTPINPEIDSKYINDSEPISNMPSVHMRDDAGNIILMDSDSTKNNVIVIEPIRKYYTVDNILRVLDTNFEYYSFPVSTIESEAVETVDIDSELADIERELADLEKEQEKDLITRDYSIESLTDDDGLPKPFRKISTTKPNKWYLGDNSAETKTYPGGYRILPFKSTNKEHEDRVGTFVITKQMIEYAKKRNQTIRFEVYIQVRHDQHFAIANGGYPDAATDSLEKRFFMRLNRREIVKRDPNTNFRNGTLAPAVYRNVGQSGVSPVLFVSYLLDPQDMYEGDMYYVEAVSQHPGSLIVDECWWRTRLEKLPTAASPDALYGFTKPTRRKYGVLKFGWDNGTKLVVNRTVAEDGKPASPENITPEVLYSLINDKYIDVKAQTKMLNEDTKYIKDYLTAKVDAISYDTITKLNVYGDVTLEGPDNFKKIVELDDHYEVWNAKLNDILKEIPTLIGKTQSKGIFLDDEIQNLWKQDIKTLSTSNGYPSAMSVVETKLKRYNGADQYWARNPEQYNQYILSTTQVETSPGVTQSAQELMTGDGQTNAFIGFIANFLGIGKKGKK
jgi:hypothetical protein